MKTIVAVLGFALVAATAAAQEPASALLPPHPAAKLKVDFGLRQALTVLGPSQRPVPVPHPQHELLTVTPAAPRIASAVDCAMVKTHKHELLTAATPVVTPQTHTRHQLKVVTVPPCPVR